MIDVTLPVIECAPTIVLYADQQCKAKVPLISPNVTDNCNSVTLEQSMSKDSLIGIGDTHINITAIDIGGNKVRL